MSDVGYHIRKRIPYMNPGTGFGMELRKIRGESLAFQGHDESEALAATEKL
jgi:hypothetical protein